MLSPPVGDETEVGMTSPSSMGNSAANGRRLPCSPHRQPHPSSAFTNAAAGGRGATETSVDRAGPSVFVTRGLGSAGSEHPQFHYRGRGHVRDRRDRQSFVTMTTAGNQAQNGQFSTDDIHRVIHTTIVRLRSVSLSIGAGGKCVSLATILA